MRSVFINQFGKVPNIKTFLVVLALILSISWFADGLIGCMGIVINHGINQKIVLILTLLVLVLLLDYLLYFFVSRNKLGDAMFCVTLSLGIIVILLFPRILKILGLKAEDILPVIQLAFSTGIFFGAYLYLKKELKDINLSVKVIEPKNIKGLIMFLSYWQNKPKNLDLTNLNDLNDFYNKYQRCPWEMQMRLIEKYKGTLKYVYAIGSKKSCRQMRDFKKIIKHFFKEKEIEIIEHQEAIDFENLKENIDALKVAFEKLKEKGLKDSEILIDTTGGQKIQSIAGAFYSSTYDRYFAYVSTNTKEVKVFDIIWEGS